MTDFTHWRSWITVQAASAIDLRVEEIYQAFKARMDSEGLIFCEKKFGANPMIAEALAKGEDTTGLCTVRELTQSLIDYHLEDAELWWEKDGIKYTFYAHIRQEKI